MTDISSAVTSLTSGLPNSSDNANSVDELLVSLLNDALAKVDSGYGAGDGFSALESRPDPTNQRGQLDADGKIALDAVIDLEKTTAIDEFGFGDSKNWVTTQDGTITNDSSVSADGHFYNDNYTLEDGSELLVSYVSAHGQADGVGAHNDIAQIVYTPASSV